VPSDSGIQAQISKSFRTAEKASTQQYKNSQGLAYYRTLPA
jgi:hypothetical protein